MYSDVVDENVTQDLISIEGNRILQKKKSKRNFFLPVVFLVFKAIFTFGFLAPPWLICIVSHVLLLFSPVSHYFMGA